MNYELIYRKDSKEITIYTLHKW